MARIIGDAERTAIAHPTRRAILESLRGAEERSTVQLEGDTGVTRYHLYHHLKHLAKSGLVENHRDHGRARHWRLTEVGSTVDATLPDAAGTPERLPPGPPGRCPEEARAEQRRRAQQVRLLEALPSELIELLDAGARLRWLQLADDAASVVNARKVLEEVAAARGLDLDLPFTFLPRGLLVVSASPHQRMG